MINIEDVRNYGEIKIAKKINLINDPNLNKQEKRLIVLNEMNSSDVFEDFIFFPENEIKIIDIERIRLFKDKQIKKKIENIKDEKLSYEQKHLKILDEENTSISSNEEEIKENKNEMKKIYILDSTRDIPESKNNLSSTRINNISNISEYKKDNYNDPDSTMENSEYMCNIGSTGINNTFEEKKDYWIKYNLYDVFAPNLNLKNLIKCDLDKDKKKFCYLYTNKLITYYFIKSANFGKDYSINDNIKDKEYNESYGLFFCGKKIEIEKNECQECLPDKMICKNCMNKNKKIYNLENGYLININGRVSIEYNGQYHCFGHFSVGNQIENCIKKFSCEACKLLDKYKKYYFPNK